MQKQKRLFVIILAFLVIMLAAFWGMKVYNEKGNTIEEEEEIEILTMAADEVTAFSYYLDDELLSFEKDGESWVYEGDTTIDIDEDEIESILSYITTLTAEDAFTAELLMEEYGFADPANIITVETADRADVIYLGNYNSLVGGYYLKLNEEDTVYLITTGITSRFSKSVEDLTVVEDTEEVTEETEEVEETTESIEETEEVPEVTETVDTTES